MGIKLKRKIKSTSGLLSLEASIVLTLFLFLMLFLYSFLPFFEARNQVAHTLLSTSDSLALDAFANESTKDETLQGIIYQLYGSTTESNGVYTNTEKWYSDDPGTLHNVIKERFVAYLSGGDTSEADKILRKLNIENGLEGLDFTQSTVSDGNLCLNVKYKLNYEFQVFGIGSADMSQSCCSKLWKPETVKPNVIKGGS